jgi:hypothetical protein
MHTAIEWGMVEMEESLHIRAASIDRLLEIFQPDFLRMTQRVCELQDSAHCINPDYGVRRR